MVSTKKIKGIHKMGIPAHMNAPTWNEWRGQRVHGPRPWDSFDFKRGVVTLSSILGVLFTFYVWKPSKSFAVNSVISLVPFLAFQVGNNAILYGDGDPFWLLERRWLS